MERDKQPEKGGGSGNRQRSVGQYDCTIIVTTTDCDIGVGAALYFWIIRLWTIHADNDCGGISGNGDSGGTGVVCDDFGDINSEQSDPEKI